MTSRPSGIASFACVAIVVALRYVTMHWNIQTKTVRALGPKK